MKKISFVLLIIFGINVNAQTTLTLEKVVSIALQRNISLIKSKNNIETNQAKVKSAYGDFLPSLDLNGGWSWTRTKDEGGKHNNFFGQEVVTPSTDIQTRGYSLGAGGRLMIFNGLSNYANLSRSKNDLEKAKLDIEKLKQDIVYQAVSLFYDVVYQQSLFKVRSDDVKYNEKFLETVQERNKLGAVAIADVYSQQVRAGNSALARIKTQNLYESAKNKLLDFLALDVLQEYEIINPIEKEVNTEKYMQEFDDLSRLVNSALHQRLDLKSQKLNIESAEKGITMSRAGLLPSISGSYSFSTGANNMDNLFDRKVFRAGLSLNIPIFSNWNTELQIQSSKVILKNAEEDLRALERKVKIEVKQGFMDLQAAKKQVDVSTKNVKSALENRNINQERYNLGSGTILDVLQSDKDYQSAVADNLNAIFQFYKFKDRLLNYLGELDYKNYE